MLRRFKISHLHNTTRTFMWCLSIWKWASTFQQNHIQNSTRAFLLCLSIYKVPRNIPAEDLNNSPHALCDILCTKRRLLFQYGRPQGFDPQRQSSRRCWCMVYMHVNKKCTLIALCKTIEKACFISIVVKEICCAEQIQACAQAVRVWSTCMSFFFQNISVAANSYRYALTCRMLTYMRPSVRFWLWKSGEHACMHA